MNKELEAYIDHFVDYPKLMFGVNEDSDEFRTAMARAVERDEAITSESYETDPFLRNMVEGVE